MINDDLSHKLELINIHFEILKMHNITIAKMGDMCPPHIKLDANERNKEVCKIITDSISIIEQSDLIIQKDILDKLKSISSSPIEMDDIALSISVFKSIISNRELEKQDVDLQKNKLGGIIIVQNSKNVIIQSSFDIDGDSNIEC